jgi:beta-glucosidase
MPSYSSWNGTHMHAERYLIEDVLRAELGFGGFIISDWQAIDEIPGNYASDVSTAINAGVDMVMVPHEYQRFQETLRGEIEAGNITMARIDEAVSRILTAKFALGLFENPFADRTHIDELGSEAHRAVARQAVQESLVLLKNDDLLPLSKDVATILVTGKSADNIGNQAGGWTISWQGQSGNITPGTTVLEAIEAAVSAETSLEYRRRPRDPLTADVGIVVIGETPYAEGQGDQADLTLDPEDQNAVERVCEAMPCVVILISGRPMIIEPQLEQADAFIAAWLPGTEGGGVADVLFGDADFSGTLPFSWPRTMEQVPINVGDADYDPLFPYGFGLGYE